MQQSSLMRFCDECGLANDPAAAYCAACQSPLNVASSVSSISPARPVKNVAPATREVTPGLLFTPSSQSAVSDCPPGTVLAGRYRIAREIGRGGFSIVYLAQGLSGSANRQVVIKRIQLSKLSPRQIIDATETFNREITMLMRFNDTTGIPRFYEHLTDPENWYLVMEYIQGTTLEEYLQKKRGGYLTEAETIEIGLGIVQIVQQLHRDNPPVIFRDLKPANIMITPKREFYLIDFGIARNFTFGKAKDTTPLGSPGYAPPEQYGRAQTDRRADIYSLGATLQTLVTGRDPLDLRAGEASLNPKPLSPALRKLLDEMLAPKADERPLDMVAVQTRLENCRQASTFWYSYRLGLLIGAILGALVLMAYAVHSFDLFWLYPISFMGLANQNVQKRIARLRKPIWPLTVLGALTVLLPCVLVLVWFLWK